MKLPIPLLLYMVSLGLFGLAGWTVYQMLPIWKIEVRDKAQKQGQAEGSSQLDKGRAQGPVSATWSYTRDTAPWWAGFKEVNLVGKLPPPPPNPDEVKTGAGPDTPPVDVRPLETLIELVSLVSDGATGGRGGDSHVIVRFKPEAGVEPPEYYLKENSAPAAGGTRPLDATPSRQPNGAGGRPGQGGGASTAGAPGRPGQPGRPPVTPMPVGAPSIRDPLQKLWVQDGGDIRRSNTLWTMRGPDGRELGKIRLVRVAEDAQSAFFVRELPPAKPGEAAPQPKEEELLKTSANLSQDLAKIIREMNGKRVAGAERPLTAAPSTAVGWDDVAETTRSGNNVIISRKDEQRFRENSDDFVGAVTFDTYAGRSGKTTGLIAKAVDSRLASYGVTVGDVLIEINGRKIASKAEAVSLVKGDYNRGVRTFTTKWLSGGQEVTRVYQAPPEK